MDKLARVGIAVACTAVVALEAIAVAGWQGWGMTPGAARNAATQVQATAQAAGDAVAALPAAIGKQLRAAHADVPLYVAPEDAYYAGLRKRIRWVPTRIGNTDLVTPDVDSRLLLVKSAADRARLWEVGLAPRDVYGIINAETSWVPRTGASKDGTPNLGIAQFEPATARALGMRDPQDPVESVHAAALHMREAAVWSLNRISGMKLSALDRGIKLREGVSIYYNLSSRGRSAWNGRNTRHLPRETQLHILNARVGARQADFLDEQLRAGRFASRDGSVVTAGNSRGG